MLSNLYFLNLKFIKLLKSQITTKKRINNTMCIINIEENARAEKGNPENARKLRNNEE